LVLVLFIITIIIIIIIIIIITIITITTIIIIITIITTTPQGAYELAAMWISTGGDTYELLFVGAGTDATFLTTVFAAGMNAPSSYSSVLHTHWGFFSLQKCSVLVTTTQSASDPFYFIYQSDYTTPFKVIDCVFTIDLNNNDGNFVYAQDAYFEICDCVFKDSSNIMNELICWAHVNDSYNGMYFKLLNTTFENLTSTSAYSIIFSHTTTSITRPITVDDCTFNNISNTHSGSLDSGGIFSFTFENSTIDFIFNNNKFNNISFSATDGSGSILYFVGTDLQSFSFENNEFNDISSSMNGALYLETSIDSSKFTIKNCIFCLCKSLYGGAIYFVGVYFFFFFH
jgi:hypothetical protein